MVFFGLVYLVFHLALLVSGKKIVKSLSSNLSSIEEDQVEERMWEIISNFLITLVLFLLVFGEIIYLIFALGVDTLFYPTVLMMTLFVGSFVKTTANKITGKKSAHMEEVSDYTISGILIHAGKVIYFAYILTLLIL